MIPIWAQTPRALTLQAHPFASLVWSPPAPRHRPAGRAAAVGARLSCSTRQIQMQTDVTGLQCWAGVDRELELCFNFETPWVFCTTSDLPQTG